METPYPLRDSGSVIPGSRTEDPERTHISVGTGGRNVRAEPINFEAGLVKKRKISRTNHTPQTKTLERSEPSPSPQDSIHAHSIFTPRGPETAPPSWTPPPTAYAQPGMEPQDGRAQAAAAVADERAPLLANGGAAFSPDPAAGAEVEVKDAHWSVELGLLTRYSLPLIATYLLQYSFFVITIAIAGHLSADDLAAASIGATTMNVIGLAVLEGMATALDTLCAQAYGSGNKAGVGLHIQRMLLLMGLSLVPIGAIWIFSPWILPLFVKQENLAVKAGEFLVYSLVGLPGYGAFEAVKRFLQAQGDCNAGMVVLIVCAPVNAALSWLLAFPMGMGLGGAALGAALSNNLRFILLMAYIVSPWGRWSHDCWGGFSRDALRKWAPMVSLSFAGIGVLIGEWAAFEILTFSTSRLSTNHLAAQTIMVRTPQLHCHLDP